MKLFANGLSYRKKFFIFLAVCFGVMLLSYIQAVLSVPGQITIIEGEEHILNFKSPFLVSIKADKEDVLKVNGEFVKSRGSFYKMFSPMSFWSQKGGSVSLRVSVFGLIPLRTMKVDVVPDKMLVACGNTIGVKLRIDGILVIGMSDVETKDGRRLIPARDGGIREGDLIIEANDKSLKSIKELVEEIDKTGGKLLKLKYKRGESYYTALITPVKAADDDKYHIGLWVRDSTAGIGTLTYYDPDTMGFGALGHGITDIDTGTLMPVKTGEILESRILSIKRSKTGVPGELKGVIEESGQLGQINSNSKFGIYGKVNEDALDKISRRMYPIALKSSIKEGPAVILSNIDGKSVEEYEIEILKVSRQNYDGSKGMVIKITDKRLLDATGGIVQGMSGSPIIQDGRIIGAVTHVLVNDPARGYGIFIENMLKCMTEVNQGSHAKAS